MWGSFSECTDASFRVIRKSMCHHMWRHLWTNLIILWATDHPVVLCSWFIQMPRCRSFRTIQLILWPFPSVLVVTGRRGCLSSSCLTSENPFEYTRTLQFHKFYCLLIKFLQTPNVSFKISKRSVGDFSNFTRNLRWMRSSNFMLTSST